MAAASCPPRIQPLADIDPDDVLDYLQDWDPPVEDGDDPPWLEAGETLLASPPPVALVYDDQNVPTDRLKVGDGVAVKVTPLATETPPAPELQAGNTRIRLWLFTDGAVAGETYIVSVTAKTSNDRTKTHSFTVTVAET